MMALQDGTRGRNGILSWCLGALFLIVIGGALLEGRRLQAARELQQAHELMNEDHSVCERLGAPPGTQAFASCALELAWVREQQRRRGAPDSDLLP